LGSSFIAGTPTSGLIQGPKLMAGIMTDWSTIQIPFNLLTVNVRQVLKLPLSSLTANRSIPRSCHVSSATAKNVSTLKNHLNFRCATPPYFALLAERWRDEYFPVRVGDFRPLNKIRLLEPLVAWWPVLQD
jgi:hypothetical protein